MRKNPSSQSAIDTALITLLSLVLAGLCSGCAATRAPEVNTPQARPESDYPPVIDASATRQQAVEDAWRLLLAEYKLPETRLELEPVLCTPRSLPTSVAGRITLASPDRPFTADEARLALRRFIERAHTVLSGDQRTSAISPKDLSLISFNDDGEIWRAVYRQMNLPYSVAGGYGEISFALSRAGALLQMNSRYLSPLLLSADLPQRAKVDPQKLVDTFIGREFTYSNIAGQPLTYKVAERNEVRPGELVLLPKVAADRLTVSLAWQIIVGRGTNWTVFIDAVTGRELEVRQNFVS